MIWEAPDVGLELYGGLYEDSGGGGWHFIWDFCLGGSQGFQFRGLEFEWIPALLP